MSQQAALLRAVIAAPDDDAPRLIYADWLDEQGDSERAEFIRLQCALETSAADSAEDAAKIERESELLDRFACLWANDLQPEVRGWTFRRGFVERIETNLQTSRDAIAAVLQKAPIRHIRDTSQMSDLSGVVAALPMFDRLTGLEFWGMYTVSDSQLREILTSPHLQNLKTLIIHYEARGRFPADDVMFDSLHSPHRSQLEELAINVDGVGRGPSRAILHALASSPYLRNLRTLNLSFIGAARGAAPIDADAIRELGASPNLARLEDLDLGDAALPSAVWNEILRWPCLPNLKRLRLAGAMLTNPPSHTLVDELAEFPELRRAFEQRVVQIEWDTETAGPWNKGTCWSGHSWVEMSRRHLLSMGRYTQRRDFAGLEAAFRQDCVYYAGEAVAQAIDALPIAEFESKVRNALYAMLPICDEFEPTVSVHFRVRPEQIGPPEFCFVCSRENVSFSDGGNDEHDGSGATLDDLTFAEAESLYERYLPVESFDSGGATHYLYARLVAAAARASAETKLSQTIHPLRLRLTCLHAVFPL